MKEKVRVFLEGDHLEQYLLGSSSTEESLRVERFIALYPEVREAYEELQENLEIYARLHAKKAPENLKEEILTNIRTLQRKRSSFFRFGIAASIAALVCIAVTYYFWNQNKTLSLENEMVQTQIRNLEMDMKLQLEDIRNQYIVLNNPNTRKFNVRGNRKAQELKAIAYINPIKKLSYINVQNLPQLPEDQCYQMWAEVNGEMVNLGIINKGLDKEQLLALPYGDKAISYITIESQGGTNSPTVQNIVANFDYHQSGN